MSWFFLRVAELLTVPVQSLHAFIRHLLQANWAPQLVEIEAFFLVKVMNRHAGDGSVKMCQCFYADSSHALQHTTLCQISRIGSEALTVNIQHIFSLQYAVMILLPHYLVQLTVLTGSIACIEDVQLHDSHDIAVLIFLRAWMSKPGRRKDGNVLSQISSRFVFWEARCLRCSLHSGRCRSSSVEFTFIGFQKPMLFRSKDSTRPWPGHSSSC